MSDDFYTDMQTTATELLTEYATGVVSIIATPRVATDPERPYDKTNGTPVNTPIPGAVVIPVDRKMVDKKTVFGNEDMVSCQHPGFEITGKMKFDVDGRERTILKIKRIPSAGIAVAWKIVLAD